MHNNDSLRYLGREWKFRKLRWGELLGSAVALALAAEKPVGRLTRGPFHFGGRSRRTALLVRASAAFHEGPVSLGFARQQVMAPVLVVHGENTPLFR